MPGSLPHKATISSWSDSVWIGDFIFHYIPNYIFPNHTLAPLMPLYRSLQNSGPQLDTTPEKGKHSAGPHPGTRHSGIQYSGIRDSCTRYPTVSGTLRRGRNNRLVDNFPFYPRVIRGAPTNFTVCGLRCHGAISGGEEINTIPPERDPSAG